MPFTGETKQEVIDWILKGKVKFPKTPTTSPEFWDLIWRILRLKWEDRIEIEDMFYHPWLFESKLKHATQNLISEWLEHSDDSFEEEKQEILIVPESQIIQPLEFIE